MNVGDRVKRVDIVAETIPSYRDMRGVVTRIQGKASFAEVQWDMDKGVPSYHPQEDLEVVS